MVDSVNGKWKYKYCGIFTIQKYISSKTITVCNVNNNLANAFKVENGIICKMKHEHNILSKVENIATKYE